MNKNLNKFIEKINAIEYELGKDLSSLSGYGTGGKAEIIVYPKNASEIATIENACGTEFQRVTIGKGSNLLISDNGYKGVVVCTSKMNEIKLKGNLAIVGSGVSLVDMVNLAKNSSLSGLEFLVGVPASVGGAVAMNAGCFNQSISQLVRFVVASGKVYANSDCKFSYRNSIFTKENLIIEYVALSLFNDEYENIEKRQNGYMQMRKFKQPKGKSCGSVFKNDGYYSAKIIESCDLKGLRVGSAEVSTKHANFIVVDSNGKSQDVFDLIVKIKKIVKEKTNINLIEEIKYIGEFK